MGISLYPPVIPNALTAMYKIVQNDEEGVALAIPFSLNRAVSAAQVNGFKAIIKTSFTNKTLCSATITDVNIVEKAINTGIINFFLTENIAILVEGQYYKVQLAFINDGTEGIYSSVATIKYTTLPKVAIQDDLSTAETNIFSYTYQGNFDNSNDPSETRDQYRFDLLLNDKIAFTSGWLFKDQYKENDEYTFTDIQENEVYKLRYGVKTINGVEVYSELYPVIKYEIVPSELAAASLRAANNFDNGYIELSLDVPPEEQETIDAVDGMFRLLRKSSSENLWTELTRIHFDGANGDTEQRKRKPSSWIYQDFLIEQGMSYIYALQQYNDRNVYSVKILSPSVEADFEDSFLYDGTKQLKLRFNPKVTSYKINRQEQKLETIGSQYPFFVRNSKIAYHEFPISGLCSYWMDEEELFMTDEELGLTRDNDTRSKTEEGPTTDFSGRRGRTLTLQGYNFAAERKFKNTVLEWLDNGKPKFFKSPAEGNFIIRVMNPSLSPEDKLSRMIHNFSATAYEVMEINQDSLFASRFIKEDAEDFASSGEDTFNKVISVDIEKDYKAISQSNANIKTNTNRKKYCCFVLKSKPFYNEDYVIPSDYVFNETAQSISFTIDDVDYTITASQEELYRIYYYDTTSSSFKIGNYWINDSNKLARFNIGESSRYKWEFADGQYIVNLYNAEEEKVLSEKAFSDVSEVLDQITSSRGPGAYLVSYYYLLDNN